jgi:hypothetical protein
MLFMYYLSLLLMNHRNMFLVDKCLMNNWLNKFMNYCLMMFMNHISVIFFYNILMMFYNFFFVVFLNYRSRYLFSHNWCLVVSEILRLRLMYFYNRSLISFNDSLSGFMSSMNNGCSSFHIMFISLNISICEPC